MKRKFNHWWSRIPSISTERTIYSHLYELTEHDKRNDYDVENLAVGTGYGQAQKLWRS